MRPALVNFIPALNGEGFQFGFTNNTGHSYSVYMSTDLVNWTLLGAPTEVSPAFFEFFDGGRSRLTAPILSVTLTVIHGRAASTILQRQSPQMNFGRIVLCLG